jgi:hypothetical protein
MRERKVRQRNINKERQKEKIRTRKKSGERNKEHLNSCKMRCKWEISIGFIFCMDGERLIPGPGLPHEYGEM